MVVSLTLPSRGFVLCGRLRRKIFDLSGRALQLEDALSGHAGSSPETRKTLCGRTSFTQTDPMRPNAAEAGGTSENGAGPLAQTAEVAVALRTRSVSERGGLESSASGGSEVSQSYFSAPRQSLTYPPDCLSDLRACCAHDFTQHCSLHSRRSFSAPAVTEYPANSLSSAEAPLSRLPTALHLPPGSPLRSDSAAGLVQEQASGSRGRWASSCCETLAAPACKPRHLCRCLAGRQSISFGRRIRAALLHPRRMHLRRVFCVKPPATDYGSLITPVELTTC